MSIRNYNMPDTDMFQGSRTTRLLFIENKDDFTDFDGDFDDPFADDWNTSNDASDSVETAETRDDTSVQESDEVNAEVRLCHKKYVQIKYFVVKAYGTDRGIMAKFGLNNYTDASASAKTLRGFMQNLYNQSNSTDFKPGLLAANCTQLKIDEILTLKDALKDETDEQQVFIKKEPLATKSRIDQYNNTVGFWRKVNEASKTIYYDQPELLNLFLFPRNTEPTSSFNVLGTVTVGGSPLAGVTVQIEALGLTTTSDGNGEFGFAAVPVGPGILKCTKPGFVEVETPFTLGVNPTVTVNVVMVPE